MFQLSLKGIALMALGVGCALGAQAGNQANAPAADTLRVMQFNIWQEGTMVPGGFEAIADEIARLDPHFVMLSEVRNYKDTRFCDRIAEALARRGKTYYSFKSYDTGLLSAYPITDSLVVYHPENDHGSLHRLNADTPWGKAAIYTSHMDYLNDTYYEVRGYDGNTWKKMDAPLTDVDEILRRNDISLRDENAREFVADAKRQRDAGCFVILGGDFNEPSVYDWTEATAHMADHHGISVPWPVSVILRDAGYADAYRVLYPDPVTHPGYTYPSTVPGREPKKVTWAPESDERDRIDYIIYDPASGLTPVKAFILGPDTSVAYGQEVKENTADVFMAPMGVWPTDHKAVVVDFIMQPVADK